MAAAAADWRVWALGGVAVVVMLLVLLVRSIRRGKKPPWYPFESENVAASLAGLVMGEYAILTAPWTVWTPYVGAIGVALCVVWGAHGEGKARRDKLKLIAAAWSSSGVSDDAIQQKMNTLSLAQRLAILADEKGLSDKQAVAEYDDTVSLTVQRHRDGLASFGLSDG